MGSTIRTKNEKYVSKSRLHFLDSSTAPTIPSSCDFHYRSVFHPILTHTLMWTVESVATTRVRAKQIIRAPYIELSTDGQTANSHNIRAVITGLCDTPPRPSYQPSGAEGGFRFAYVPVSVCTTASQRFLVVQCKRTGPESRTSTWDEGVQQLDQYLSATNRTRHANLTPVYGIVAVGLCMRVYQYDDATNSVDIVDPGVPHT